jgi:hypothetical protein
MRLPSCIDVHHNSAPEDHPRLTWRAVGGSEAACVSTQVYCNLALASTTEEKSGPGTNHATAATALHRLFLCSSFYRRVARTRCSCCLGSGASSCVLEKSGRRHRNSQRTRQGPQGRRRYPTANTNGRSRRQSTGTQTASSEWTPASNILKFCEV